MAAFVSSARAALASAAKAAEKELLPRATEAYTAAVKGGEEYIVRDPVAAAKLPKQLFYTTLARWVGRPAPPGGARGPRSRTGPWRRGGRNEGKERPQGFLRFPGLTAACAPREVGAQGGAPMPGRNVHGAEGHWRPQHWRGRGSLRENLFPPRHTRRTPVFVLERPFVFVLAQHALASHPSVVRVSQPAAQLAEGAAGVGDSAQLQLGRAYRVKGVRELATLLHRRALRACERASEALAAKRRGREGRGGGGAGGGRAAPRHIPARLLCLA